MNRFSKILNNHGVRNTGDNLLGYEIDMEYYLEECDLFESVLITRPHLNKCMLKAICKIKNDVKTEIIKNKIEDIWLNYLRYSEFEEHDFVIDGNGIKLNFVTYAPGLGIIGEILCRY